MRSLTIQESGVTSTLDIYEFGSGSPRVVFTAGIHGGEVTGVYVAEQLIEYFTHNPPLKGSVKILPRCNPTATRCLQRRSPFDSEDLNRIFPGSAQGSLSHRTADAVWHETADADYLIDLHCCGQHGLPYLLGIYDESQPARALAEQIAMPIAVQSGGTAGQLFTDSCRHRGQAAIIIELPSGPSSGAVNPVVAEQAVTGLLSFLTRIGIIEGRENPLRPTFYGPLLDICVPESGLWVPQVQRGETLKAGQTVGTLNGKPVCAVEDGFAMSVLPISYVFIDDPWVVTYVVERP